MRRFPCWDHPIVAALGILSCHGALAGPLQEPRVIASASGELSVLVVAREQKRPQLPGAPVGWVYEVCRWSPEDGPWRRCPGPGLSPSTLRTCPTAEEAGLDHATRLQVQPGDALRVRFVNCLPAVSRDVPVPGEFKWVGQGGDTLLHWNPTNLHTHGMLVEPRCATDADRSYGDWIFVLALNPANHPPPGLVGRHACQPSHPKTSPGGASHPVDHSTHFDVTPDGVIDYIFRLPRDHPLGLYWVHPHAHGLALNQVSAGLAVLLTVGAPDAACRARGCTARGPPLTIRHLVLQDVQVLTGGRLRLQQTSDFCAAAADPRPEQLAPATCPGVAPNGRGGTWVFTVNGQLDPEIAVTDARGEVWRILDASANAVYWLSLQEVATGKDLPMQILAVDGVGLDVPAGTPLPELQERLGAKVHLVPCPKGGPFVPRRGAAQPVCAERVVMMPSARLEIAVAHRARGEGRAILRTHAWNTGPTGNTYPGVALASVQLPPPQAGPPAEAVEVQSAAGALLRPGGALSRTLAGRPPAGSTQGAACEPLGRGSVRRIVFGEPGASTHGLGAQVVTEGAPLVPPEGFALTTFDHAAGPTVCVPLGPRGAPASEVWELVNLSAEDHNFHIHQTRFELLSGGTLVGDAGTPAQLGGAVVLHDNVPVPRGGTGCDGTVASWRSGACVPSRVVVRIPFTIAGDFVYHCHILGHEDAGMMAKISVVPGQR